MRKQRRDDGGIVHRVQAAEAADAVVHRSDGEVIDLRGYAAHRLSVDPRDPVGCLAMGEKGAVPRIDELAPVMVERRDETGLARIEVPRQGDELRQVAA